MRRRAYLAVAATLACAAPLAVNAQSHYAVVSFRSDLEPDAEIGAKRAGLACIRLGSYRWRDVRPSAADAIEILTSALSKVAPERMIDGETVFASLPGNDAHRLTATVTAAALDACRPTWVMSPVGGGKSVRGSASVTILWRSYAPETGSLRDTRGMTTNIVLSRTTGSVEEGLKAALVANAAAYAKARWSADTSVPTP
jgi:hypothetical protein